MPFLMKWGFSDEMLGDSSVVAFPVTCLLGPFGWGPCLSPTQPLHLGSWRAGHSGSVCSPGSFFSGFLYLEGGGGWPSCTLYSCLYLLGTLYLMPFIFF